MVTPIQPFPIPGPPINAASADNVPAVQGTSISNLPLAPGLGSGVGVVGASGSGVGVQAFSDTGIGLQVKVTGKDGGNAINATCAADTDAIVATSSSRNHAAVSGVNNSGGFALWGASDSDNGTGIFARGKRQAAQFVQTDSGSDEDGVVSTASTAKHAAVSATNTGGGFAFWGASDSDNGTGIYARGKKQAAWFDGDTHVNNGKLFVASVDVAGAITALLEQTTSLLEQTTSLRNQLVLLQSDVAEVRGEVASLKASVINLQNEITDLSNRP